MIISHSHGGRDRTFVLGPCLDRLVRIAMAIELRVEREREVEVDSSWRARYEIRRPERRSRDQGRNSAAVGSLIGVHPERYGRGVVSCRRRRR